ncbi:MAG: methyltransferase domain-containing protein [Sphingomonas sp.]
MIEYLHGKILDIGAGQFKVVDQAMSVDNGHHEGFGHVIKPDYLVKTAAQLPLIGDATMDCTLSSHLLEHFPEDQAIYVLREWFRTVKVGGTLCLYLPEKGVYPDVGEYGANPDHKFTPTRQQVIDWMLKVGAWDLEVDESRSEGNEYSFLQVYRRLPGRQNLFSCQKPKSAEKTAACFRVGAFGDMLQASSVIKGLKDDGYVVTVYASEPGCQAIEHDPHIDKLIRQEKDMVPNHLLGEFWDVRKKRYDKWVNLSESVESTLLSIPHRITYKWPKETRHRLMNHNYLEVQHELAGVPHIPQVRFYATESEKCLARNRRAEIGRDWSSGYMKENTRFIILWSLAGSSIHKVYAGMDEVMQRTLDAHPEAHIVLVGGPECQKLEAGWEDNPRVTCTSGKWSIRKSLAFIDQADLIIGPETGILNAACCLPVPKIIFLSHSTEENLTRDWINTTAMVPQNTPCYPCHMMHLTWDSCKRDDRTGTAACQASIDPETVAQAIASEIDAWRSRDDGEVPRYEAEWNALPHREVSRKVVGDMLVTLNDVTNPSDTAFGASLVIQMRMPGAQQVADPRDETQ